METNTLAAQTTIVGDPTVLGQLKHTIGPHIPVAMEIRKQGPETHTENVRLRGKGVRVGPRIVPCPTSMMVMNDAVRATMGEHLRRNGWELVTRHMASTNTTFYDEHDVLHRILEQWKI